MGAPNDTPEPFMGPLITEQARNRVLDAQERLLSQGGEVLLRCEPDDPGFFLSPGIVDVTDSEQTSDEEVFGPLLQLWRESSFDAALSRASETRFGLAAGLVSTSPEEFARFREEVPAGLLYWNQQLTGASGLAPFGGVKASGNHRPAGILSVDYVADGTAVTEVSDPSLPLSLPPGIRTV